MPRRRGLFDKTTAALIVLTVLLAAFGVWYYFFYSEPVSGAAVSGETSAKAETPYGESLEIELSAGGETTGCWRVAYTDSSSQNVYTVDGVYKSQEQVTLSYSLSVTYSNVQDIKIVELYIKAVDTSDQSSFKYTLASNKALSGTSPISDSGSTTKSITQHLNDIQGSTTDCTVDYYIYCKVQGTGTVSGQTLTAEIAETKFATLHYVRETESAEASVTPSVSVASWWELAATPEGIAIIVLLILIVGVAVGYHPKKKARKHRGRR